MWTRSNLRCLWRGFCFSLKCPVPKLQCCHNEVLPCNYPAVRYTQQPSRESAENSVCVCKCVAVPRCEQDRLALQWAALTWGGRAWWIMELWWLHQYCKIRSLLAPGDALTADVFLINAEPSCFVSGAQVAQRLSNFHKPRRPPRFFHTNTTLRASRSEMVFNLLPLASGLGSSIIQASIETKVTHHWQLSPWRKRRSTPPCYRRLD